MAEQIPNLKPVHSPFDEAFFKEVEKRAFRGARRAIFQATLLSLATNILLWSAIAAATYLYAVPVAEKFIEEKVPKIPTTQNMMDQLDQLQKLYSK